MDRERQTKRQRVSDYLDAHDLDAVLLSRRCNFSWYTCGAHNYVSNACDAGNSWLLAGRDGANILTTNIEATRLRGEEIADAGIDVVEFPYWDSDARKQAFDKALGAMRTAADAPNPAGLDTLGDDFDTLRWTLTDQEIVRYRALCDDVVACVERIARSARPGQTENELAGELAASLRAAGCMPWVLLVGADDRLAAHRHPLPTDAPVERIVMLVTCAERGGLISACTRLVSFGPLSADLAARHAATATVDTALITATRAGATLGDIFAEGVAAYDAVGFPDQWRLHHQGGSCGYLPREVVAAPAQATVVLANQAFAWNPSITGTKCEDTIICLPDGAQLLARRTGWPLISAEWNGQTIGRPDILIK